MLTFSSMHLIAQRFDWQMVKLSDGPNQPECVMGAAACSVMCAVWQVVWQPTEQSPLLTRRSELAWGCRLCNKAFNGHTASPCLPGANTKSLFTVACPDVSELFISLWRLAHSSAGWNTHKKLFQVRRRSFSRTHAIPASPHAAVALAWSQRRPGHHRVFYTRAVLVKKVCGRHSCK